MSLVPTRPALALAVAALLASACGASPDDGDLSAETVAAETSALESGITIQVVASMSSADPSAAAAEVVAAPESEGCRTRVRDAASPNVVHVYLDGCTGRLGGHTVSGEVVVAFSTNPDGTLHAEHQSVDLTIDGLPATRVATADITLDGDQRHIVWHGETTRTTEDGEAVTHTGDHLIDVDRSTRCRVVNGTGLTFRGDQEIHSVLHDVATCEGPSGEDYCPTGTIEHDNITRDRQSTRHFDGSNVALVEIHGPRHDKTKAIALACTPAGA
jgi:hypothetical protein